MASRRGKKSNQPSPKSPVRGTWTPEEDQALTNAVKQYGAKNWKKIAELVPGRSDVQCLHRWQKVLNPALIKGPWTDEEDEKVKKLVEEYGPKKWSLIASHLPGRIGKQCRERWANHLDPNVKKGDWQPWEDEMIIKLQRVHGNKWAKMTKDLPGRTDNAIKNRFNSTISRRLKQEKSQAAKSRRVAQKIAPSKRAPPSPPSHESVSSAGVTKKRYPSRSTTKLRQSVLNKSLALEQEVASSPPPSSPLSLSSLQSYTSEEEMDDNFIGDSEEEQSDHTISSDADFEDPSETKSDAPNISVLKPDFTELVELCANDLGSSAGSSAPKIVLCKETPEGTRVFDTEEVVAALSAVSLSPCRSPGLSPAYDFFPDIENQHVDPNIISPVASPLKSPRYSPRSPSPAPKPVHSPNNLLSPFSGTSAFGRPRRSTCNYNRYNRNQDQNSFDKKVTNGSNGSSGTNGTNGSTDTNCADTALAAPAASSSGRKPLARLSPAPASRSPVPLKSAFSPVSSPATLEPHPFSPSISRPLRQFIPTTPQNKRAKRRLDLAEEEEGAQPPAKRIHTETVASSEDPIVNPNLVVTHTLPLLSGSTSRAQPSPKKEGTTAINIHTFIEDLNATTVQGAVAHLSPKPPPSPLLSSPPPTVPANHANHGTPGTPSNKVMDPSDPMSRILAPATLVRFENTSTMNIPSVAPSVVPSVVPSAHYEQVEKEDESNSLSHSDGGYFASLALCKLHSASNTHILEV